MDLFDLLEKVFRGIVYFIYNVVETIATIVRHPLRGPVRLHRLHVRPGTRQVGGLTFLFLAFFAFYWVVLGFYATQRIPTATSLAEDIAAASMSAPSLSGEGVWPVLLSSLISSVLIDAALRLMLRWRLPLHPQWRHLMLGAVEFSFLWLLLAAFVWVELLLLLFDKLLFGNHPWIELLDATIRLVTLIGAPLPAALILRRAFLSRGTGGLTKGATTVVLAIGLLGLFIGSSYVGISTGVSVQDRRTEVEKRSALPSVETMRCAWLPDKRVEVEALLKINHETPRTVDRRDFALVLESSYNLLSPQEPGDPPPGWNSHRLRWTQDYPSRFMVVSKDRPVIVQLRSVEPLLVKPDMKCRLFVLGTLSTSEQSQVADEGGYQ